MSLSSGHIKFGPIQPERILPVFHERIWGSTHLEPWFPNSTRKVGEVWFPTPGSEVLVKLLFAEESLSVQVHPGDALARKLGHPRGKTEMWHILRAGPDSRIALGFEGPVSAERVRRAAADGSIMGLLRWIPAHAGESWFIPAGAVHAIGANVVLCEVQQNSDLTYRLYDYGRGRDLHVEESLRALDLTFEPGEARTGANPIADCAYFRVDLTDVVSGTPTEPVDLAVVLEGEGDLSGEPYRAGDVFRVASAMPLSLSGQGRLLTVTTKISAGPSLG